MDDCCSYTVLGDEAGAAFACTAPSGACFEAARGPGSLSGRLPGPVGERRLASAATRARAR